jgi:FKBP-type peptidyl-prolyl cis-trans isomerase SlyD
VNAGEAVSVTLEPADAFGEYDAALVKVEPVSRLPADVATGMMFEAYANDGDRDVT